MKLSDRVNQRLLFGLSAITQVIGMALLAIFPLTLPVALIHVFLMAVGQGFGAQCFFQLWSSEMFPTLLRSTAQGVMRSEEHTSELQSLMRRSYAVFCLKKTNT